MTKKSGPIYEPTLNIDRDVAGDIDSWLATHVEEMLLIPGFTGAKIFTLEDEQDRVRRVTHYYLADAAALEHYLDGPAASMRQATNEKFAGRCDASRRILQETDSTAIGSARHESCLNCGSALTGQYCGNCGQRARSRLISIWELLQEAFGELLELDSRIWQTLIPLAVRPGQLTRDYLRGRRARFMPPFRTYLVLSLLFFLVAFFDPQESLGILFEPTPAPSPEQIEEDKLAREELLRDLADEGILVVPPVSDEVKSISDSASSGGLTISIDQGDSDADCNFDDFDPKDMPLWLARRLTKERLQVMCDRMFAKDGTGLKGFLDKLLENVPAGLFVLLPLMALFLNIIYPLSKRYYVEHLLFVVHYHAFIFLALIIQILAIRIIALLGLPEDIGSIFVIATAIYIGVYLYKAMRRVYEQNRFVTVLKFIVLFIAYSIGLTLILATAGIIAAFSI